LCYIVQAMGTDLDLAAWVRSFPYEKSQAQLRQLQAAQRRLAEEINRLVSAIEFYKTQLKLMDLEPPAELEVEEEEGQPPLPMPRTPVAPPVPQAPLEGSQSGRPTLRNAVVILLQQARGEPRSTAELRDELVGRGWLRPDRQGRNNLHAMLSIMTKSGQLLRVATGVYRLPDGTWLSPVREQIAETE
jgi:hypothetical protein